jgi:hypothetical protein
MMHVEQSQNNNRPGTSSEGLDEKQRRTSSSAASVNVQDMNAAADEAILQTLLTSPPWPLDDIAEVAEMSWKTEV